METTATISEKLIKGEITEAKPNPYNLKTGETVIMDADTDNPRKVKIESMAHRGFGACVREANGQGWSVSVNCLSPL